MEDLYYSFVKEFENRDVIIILNNQDRLVGYVEVTYPADEDDDGRISFTLATKHGMRDIFLDEISSIQLA